VDAEQTIDNVCKNIKMIRTKRGLTQVEVARRLGITKQAYSIWEKHSTGMSLLKLCRVANILECKLTDFFIEI